MDHCQVGVFLPWWTAKSHALIDRTLYLPEEWAEDEERRRASSLAAGWRSSQASCRGEASGAAACPATGSRSRRQSGVVFAGVTRCVCTHL